MSETTMLHIRIDEELKEEAIRTLAAMGFSLAEAVRIFLKRVIAEQAIPFEIKVPNAKTRAAMKRAHKMIQNHKLRFSTAEELFDELEKNS